jgi:hypothetical protein
VHILLERTAIDLLNREKRVPDHQWVVHSRGIGVALTSLQPGPTWVASPLTSARYACFSYLRSFA